MNNQFYTEYPVAATFDRSQFVRHVINWISGIGVSGIDFTALDSTALSGDFIEIKGVSAERLEFCALGGHADDSIGARYEYPDEEGRVWRTELVLRRTDRDAFLSVRVVCISLEDGANIVEPKRPVIVRQIIENGHGGHDGDMIVSDVPHYLATDEIERATDIIVHGASLCLPIVYMSSRNDDSLALDAERLARDLSGIAHVVVEPDRAFSFLVRDATNDRNPYDGAIGIGLPGQSMNMRILGWGPARNISLRLTTAVREVFVGRVARFGWEWATLQQQMAQVARSRISANTRTDDLENYIATFDDEIAAKDQEIERLKSENARLQGRLVAEAGIGEFSQIIDVLRGSAMEIYPGEFLDRIRNAVAASSNDSSFSPSDRDRGVMSKLFPLLQATAESESLTRRLREAAKSAKPKEEFESILEELGYSIGSGGKHRKATPPENAVGLKVITLPNTPSDHRSWANVASQIRNVLGLRFPNEAG